MNSRMKDDSFDGQMLSEKLSKLNSSQQSIESLSRWCISNRKTAKQIVESWDKAFNNAQREQRVSFLYLANDILQNSRRKGTEFVNEFWKFLPSALKHVYETGDENGKKAACRLVDIWEERKVFGSRGQNLKDEMLGKVPPKSVSNGKGLNPIIPIKIVKRDAQSLRVKLGVGGMPEKIITAFQSVNDQDVTEEAASSQCIAAVSFVEKVEKDVENTYAKGNEQGCTLVHEIQEQENVLNQCVGQLKNAEAIRAALVSELKEALREQESKLEFIRTQLHVAHGQIEQMSSMRHRLTSRYIPSSLTTSNQPTKATMVVEPNLPSIQPTSMPTSAVVQPVISFATLKYSEEENKKAAAAAVAAKLAASTSSAQMLTSILSSLVAEEAASMSGSLKSAGFTTSLAMFTPEKRVKLEKLTPVTDVNNSEMGNPGYFTSLQQQQMANMAPVLPTSMPAISQANLMHPLFPPPPPVPPANCPPNQFVQSAGMMVGVMPYGYSANNPPPPPPLPSHIAIGLARPAAPLQSPPQQPRSQEQQTQQPTDGGYYRSLGIGFYGQNHQPATPPVPRQ